MGLALVVRRQRVPHRAAGGRVHAQGAEHRHDRVLGDGDFRLRGRVVRDVHAVQAGQPYPVHRASVLTKRAQSPTPGRNPPTPFGGTPIRRPALARCPPLPPPAELGHSVGVFPPAPPVRTVVGSPPPAGGSPHPGNASKRHTPAPTPSVPSKAPASTKEPHAVAPTPRRRGTPRSPPHVRPRRRLRPRPARHRPRPPPRHLHRRDGPLRLGQEHVPPVRGGSGPPDRRRRPARRRGHHRPEREPPDQAQAQPHRLRVPVVQPAAVADGPAEHPAAAAAGRPPPGPPPGRGAAGPGRPGGLRPPPPRPALRRPAAARGHRPSPGHRPRGDLRGRADRARWTRVRPATCWPCCGTPWTPSARPS